MQEKPDFLKIPKQLRRIILSFLNDLDFVRLSKVNKYLNKKINKEFSERLKNGKEQEFVSSIQKPLEKLEETSYKNIANQISTNDITTKEKKISLFEKISKLRMESSANGHEKSALINEAQKQILKRVRSDDKKHWSLGLDTRSAELEKKLKEKEAARQMRSTKTL